MRRFVRQFVPFIFRSSSKRVIVRRDTTCRVPTNTTFSHNLNMSLIFLALLAGCAAGETAPTLTPTAGLSAPTLAPSPTVQILNSDELYGDTSIGGQNNPVAAALPSGGELPPLMSGTLTLGGAQSIQTVLADGTLLNGDLYINGDFRVPGVLLLAPDRLAWGLLPLQLHSAGMSVLVVDLPPNATDITTILISFSELNAVDPARLGVIGADSGANMALNGCAIYAACDALVLLSPDGRDSLPSLMPNFNPRPLLISVAQTDTEAYLTSVALAGLSGDAQLVTYDSGRGASLLALYPDLTNTIVTWMTEHLKG